MFTLHAVLCQCFEKYLHEVAAQPIREEAYLKDVYSQLFCTQEVNVYIYKCIGREGN